MAGKKRKKLSEEAPEAASDAPASSSSSSSSPSPAPASTCRRGWPRAAAIGVATLYLVTVWLDGVGSTLPSRFFPRPWVYFSQVAALFKTAAPKVIDYRAEGWSCSDKKWVEIDVRPYFLLDRDTKENRFQRALQFYRKNRAVMRALDDFVVRRHNARADKPIGGVRFLSLRLPYPAPGEHVAPFERRPLAQIPKEQRHDWYWTPKSKRVERCGPERGGDDDDDKLFSDPADHKDPKDQRDHKEDEP